MKGKEKLEEKIEIANPQHPHCPVALLLDTSGSMAGNKIDQLNEGLKFFKKDIMEDELARKRVDLAVIAFNTNVNVVHDFSSIEDFEPLTLEANGYTAMGQAILTAMDTIEKRKSEYKSKGIDYYRPWIFMITDGEPTDMYPGDSMWNNVIKEVREGEANRKFLFFAVGVEPANMEILQQIAPPNRKPIKLKEGKFKEMFEWLSKSQKRVSASRIGEQIKLENPVCPEGWGEASTL